MTDTEELVIDRHDGVAVVRLNRPERRNAIDIDTCRALTQYLLDSADDRTIRSIVLTGTDRDFCTGADAVGSNTTVTETPPLDYRWKTRDFNRLFEVLWEVEKPVVSAVNGTVAGAGWLLALLADLVVAAERARWTHVYLRRGMVPHAGDPYYLPRILGFHRLNELAMLGEPVASETLADWGAVNRVVPADAVLGTALDLAARLAAGPTRSIAAAKRLYRHSLDRDLHAAHEEEAAALALIATTSDRLEGVQSFIEQRPPEFIGD